MTEITDPYERGFIDGMNHQAKSSVDKAVNAMVKPWVGLTDDEIWEVYKKVDSMQYMKFSRAIEAKLREAQAKIDRITVAADGSLSAGNPDPSEEERHPFLQFVDIESESHPVFHAHDFRL